MGDSLSYLDNLLFQVMCLSGAFSFYISLNRVAVLQYLKTYLRKGGPFWPKMLLLLFVTVIILAQFYFQFRILELTSLYH